MYINHFYELKRHMIIYNRFFNIFFSFSHKS